MDTKDTKAKAKSATIYVATWQRSELDGHVYGRGDETELVGLSAAEIGYVVAKRHYDVKNPETLSPEIVAAIAKEQG